MCRPTFQTLALLCSCSSSLLALDWPQYFGPNGDLTSTEVIRTNWAEQTPRELWRKPIGPGFSSMAVSAGKVFTLVRRPANGVDHEWCVAFDAETGTELWAADVDVADYTQLSGYDQAMDGPRSTPTVDGERLYVFTSQLKLTCLGTAQGDPVWSRDFRAELSSDLIAWENSASPLVVGDLIFVNSNASGKRLMAVRKSDGSTVWAGQDDVMTHATPVFAKLASTPQVIFLTHSGLVSVVPEDGTVLWRLGFTPSSTSTAASPAVAGDYVLASSAYGYGAWVAKVSKDAGTLAATQAWYQQGTAYQSHWSTPVLHDGFLYCVPAPNPFQGRLTCLDVAGGTNCWTQMAVGSGSMGYGSLIKAGNMLVVLTEAGELVLVKPDPAAYTEIAKLKVLEAYCWNHVALANGRIYARSTSRSPEIVAIDVSTPTTTVPLPAVGLSLTLAPNDAGVQLTLRALDGSTLSPSQAARFELFSTTDLLLPAAQWSVVNQPFAPGAGAWTTLIPLGNEPARFLSVREKKEAP